MVNEQLIELVHALFNDVVQIFEAPGSLLCLLLGALTAALEEFLVERVKDCYVNVLSEFLVEFAETSCVGNGAVH